jgi:hypothetical protein
MTADIPVPVDDMRRGSTFPITFEIEGVGFKAYVHIENGNETMIERVTMVGWCSDIAGLFYVPGGFTFSDRIYEAAEYAALKEIE